jgi:translation initiation factor 5B
MTAELADEEWGPVKEKGKKAKKGKQKSKAQDDEDEEIGVSGTRAPHLFSIGFLS